MARGSTREWDENETEAALLHWGWRRSPCATILDCVLENYVPLLVHAVKVAQEKPSITNPHQHSAEKQGLHLAYRI